MTRLSIGLPSKGRLQADTINWFAEHGLKIIRDGNDREYAASVEDEDGISIVLLAAAEIPKELSAGRIHMGVTGEDLIRERIPNHTAYVDLVAAMGFGHADLVVAVPSFWMDVSSMHDLDEAAYAFRQRHGRSIRIATKYHTLAREFLNANGVADYRLVDSQGATEAAPKNQSAEAIIDITSSGETLRANHLKILDDGLILKSQATLCVSKVAHWSDIDAATTSRVSGILKTPLSAGQRPKKTS